MFSGRMYFTDKLVGMGARIILCDPYRVLIQGPTQLYSEKLESPDIRAGMALLLAALAAKGTSKIRNVVQIERDMSELMKTASVGARSNRRQGIKKCWRPFLSTIKLTERN
jgi:UDP-N-acetylglucosamine 1-carboxyvinyltransferase